MRRLAATTSAVAVMLAGDTLASGWRWAESSAGPLVVAVAGDICSESPDSCRPSAGLIANRAPDVVVALGDTQYPTSSLAEYEQSYDLTWGAHLGRTIPVIGNHEIKKDPAAGGFCAYFGAAARCGPEAHQYAVDRGRWTLVVVDSNGGNDDPTELAAYQALLNAAKTEGDNILVAMHHPRWTSPGRGSHGDVPDVGPLWTRAVASGVDVIVSAHDHRYERYARMTDGGPHPAGIPLFINGAGGAYPDPTCSSLDPGSRICAGDVTGVLMLRLGDTSFGWSFVKADGTVDGVVIDTGTHLVR